MKKEINFKETTVMAFLITANEKQLHQLEKAIAAMRRINKKNKKRGQ